MPVTLNDLRNQARHACGGSIDPRMDIDAICNEAGRFLFDLHSWMWRMRPPIGLDFVGGQPYVVLPADFGFGQVISLDMAETISYRVEPVDLSQIAMLREQAFGDTTYAYRYAIAFPGQTSTKESAGLARLELYPTPASSQINAASLTYRAGWVPLLSGDSAANIPPSFDFLLKQLTRAYARSYVLDDPSGIDRYPRQVRSIA